jgi:hypothetical protein
MSYVLPALKSKAEIDHAIRSTVDKLLILRFGYDSDMVCMRQDDIVSIFVSFVAQSSPQNLFSSQLAKGQHELSKMADIFLVDVDAVPIYVQYFDVTIIPATIFFFNQQHMKVDYG